MPAPLPNNSTPPVNANLADLHAELKYWMSQAKGFSMAMNGDAKAWHKLVNEIIAGPAEIPFDQLHKLNGYSAAFNDIVAIRSMGISEATAGEYKTKFTDRIKACLDAHPGNEPIKWVKEFYTTHAPAIRDAIYRLEDMARSDYGYEFPRIAGPRKKLQAFLDALSSLDSAYGQPPVQGPTFIPMPFWRDVDVPYNPELDKILAETKKPPLRRSEAFEEGIVTFNSLQNTFGDSSRTDHKVNFGPDHQPPKLFSQIAGSLQLANSKWAYLMVNIEKFEQSRRTGQAK